MPAFIDLTGSEFGRLTVLSARRTKSNRTAWLCLCKCGNEKTVQTADLRSGATTSCGCYQKQRARETQQKHDHYGTPIYRTWRNMKSRCLNPKIDMYLYYGGRGITVCDKWMDFLGFFEDMGPTYEKGLTIERIDVNGDYRKDNCKWATSAEQANNKTNNRIFTVDGETETLKNICMRRNAKYDRVRQRLDAGLTIDQALLLPVQPGKKLKTP